jgi:hypothetical protein
MNNLGKEMCSEKPSSKLSSVFGCVLNLLQKIIKRHFLSLPFFKAGLNNEMKEIVQVERSTRVTEHKLVVLNFDLYLNSSVQSLR